SGLRERVDEFDDHGIIDVREDDRDRRSRGFRAVHRPGARSEDRVHLESHQIPCEALHLAEIVISVSVFELDVPPFGEAFLAQAFAEIVEIALDPGAAAQAEDADRVYAVGGLGAYRRRDDRAQ